MSDFKLPDLGENIESGDVVSVLVKEGDVIKAQQDVIEIETDKAVIAVPSDVGGNVTKIHVAQGQTVKPGQVILSLQPSAAGVRGAGQSCSRSGKGHGRAGEITRCRPCQISASAPAKAAAPANKPHSAPAKAPLRRKPPWRRANRLLRRSRTTRMVIPRQSLHEQPTKKMPTADEAESPPAEESQSTTDGPRRPGSASLGARVGGRFGAGSRHWHRRTNYARRRDQSGPARQRRGRLSGSIRSRRSRGAR